MLNGEILLLTLNDVRDDFIEQTAESMGYLKRQAPRTTRRIGRTFLIAAVIVCFMASAAFAIGYTLHQRRQAALSAMMKIEENNVGGYVEYGETSAEKDKPHMELISSISDGDFYKVYLSISPVSEDEVQKFIMSDSSRMLFYFAGNSNPPDGEQNGFVQPVFSRGEDSNLHQKMITDPDTGEIIVGLDATWVFEQILGQSYDSKTQSLMVMCSVHKSYADWQMQVYLSVKMIDLGTLPESGAGIGNGCVRDFGTVQLKVAETNELIFDFSYEPLAIENPDGGSGNILSVTVRAAGAEWRIHHDDMEKCYALNTLNLEGEEFMRAFETQLSWINFIDRIMNGAYLTMDDGSTFQLMASNVAPYEDGIVTLYSDWNSTIDISRVVSITINEETRTVQ